MQLYGRDAELAALSDLLDRARHGTSGTLVLRGDPGIGKTALVSHVIARADGFRVIRGAGIEEESELPFAGLHLLLRLPDGRDPEQVAALAAKHDVQLENASRHWADHCTAPPTLLVGYGAQREHALAHGIEALAAEPW